MSQKLMILFIILLTSCSTEIEYKMPISRFQTPETSGQTLSGNAYVAYEGATKVVLSTAERSTIYDEYEVNNDKSTSRSRGIAIGANLGIIPMLDIYFASHADSPAFLGAKLQLIGGAPKESGFKFLIGGGLGNAEDDVENFSSTNFEGDETRTYQSTLKISAYELISSMGYRFNESVLFYISGFYSEYVVDGSLTSDTLDDVTFESTSRNKGGNVGLKLTVPGGGRYVSVEGGYGKSEYRDLGSDEFLVYGFSTGLEW